MRKGLQIHDYLPHSLPISPTFPHKKQQLLAEEEINLYIFFPLKSQFLEAMSINGLFSFGTMAFFQGRFNLWRQMNMAAESQSMRVGERERISRGPSDS